MHYEIHKVQGVTVVCAPMQDATSTTIEIMVKAWSVYEQRANNGISHFLEHMFFKGGIQYPTPKAVAEAVDRFGGEFNAYTSDEYAGYYVKCAPTFIHDAITVLADMLVDTQFPQEEMEREKSVVIQEMAMYEDMPHRLVYDKWKLRYYGDNAYGWPILGSADTVNTITRDDLFAHKQSLYTKDNLIIVVAWRIDDAWAILDQIGMLFDRLPAQKSSLSPIYIDCKPTLHQSHFDKQTQQNHLIISANGYTMQDDRRYAAKLMATILGWSMSSRLFQRIREQQWLCYYIRAAHSSDMDSGVMYISAGIEKERRDHGLAAIYHEIEDIATHAVTDEEYEIAQWNIAGSTQMGIETSDSLASFVGMQYLLLGTIESLDTMLLKYQTVTKDEISQTASNLLQSDQLYAYWIQ